MNSIGHRDYVDVQQLLKPDKVVEGHPVEVHCVGWAVTYSCLKCNLERVPYTELLDNPCEPLPLHTHKANGDKNG